MSDTAGLGLNDIRKAYRDMCDSQAPEFYDVLREKCRDATQRCSPTSPDIAELAILSLFAEYILTREKAIADRLIELSDIVRRQRRYLAFVLSKLLMHEASGDSVKSGWGDPVDQEQEWIIDLSPNKEDEQAGLLLISAACAGILFAPL